MDTNFSSLDSIVTKAMMQIGLSPEYNGYYFLRDSIKIACTDPEAALLVTKLIYPSVAKMYDTTTKNIEKSIRVCIKSMWIRNTQNGNNKQVAVLDDYYNFTESKPENKDFILELSNIIRKSINAIH